MSKLILEKNLPDTWILTNIESICHDPQYGYTTSANNSGNLKFLRTTDITSGNIDWNTVPYCKKNPDIIDKYILKHGDIVISRAGSIGYSYLIQSPPKSVFASYLIRFNPLILPEFFSYFLQSSYYWKAISETKIGIAVQNVNATKLKQILIPIPPLNEQKKIVSKIEEYFSFAEYTVKLLEQNKKKILNYYASIVSNVFSGKLTSSFRTKISDNLTFESEFEDVFKVDFNENSEEYEKLGFQNNLPDNWIWTNLEKLKEFSLYGPRYSSKDYADTGCSVLRTSDINESGKVDFENSPKLKLSKSEFEKYSCVVDDILFTRTGSLGTLAIFNDDVKSIPSAYLIQYRLKKLVKNSSWYIFYFFKSSLGQKSLISRGAGVGRPNLNAPNIESILIPFAPISEQKEMMKILRSTQTTIENLIISIEHIQKSIALFKKSVLKQAFEGKLVPQDPNDESAEILLQKIKQEKEQYYKKIKQEQQLIQKQKPSKRKKNVK